MFNFFLKKESESVKKIKNKIKEREYSESLLLIKEEFVSGNHEPVLYKLASDSIGSLGGVDESKMFLDVWKTPKNSKAYFNLGYHFMDVNNPSLAEPILKKALDLDPENVSILLEMALAKAYDNKTEESYKLALKAKEIYPDAASLYHCSNYGIMNHNENEVKSFLDKINIDEVKKNNGEYYYNLILNLKDTFKRYKILGKPEKNIRDWHFVQYGGVILDFQKTEKYIAGGRYVGLFHTYESIKMLLDKMVCMWKVLDNNGIKKIVSIGGKGAEITGVYLSKKLDIKCQHFEMSEEDGSVVVLDNNDKDNFLIVTDDSENFKYIHEGNLLKNINNNIFFSLNLAWKSVQPFSPDIVGNISQTITFPWDGGGMKIDENGEVQILEADERMVDEIVGEMMLINSKENECDGTEWYEDKKGYLTASPEKLLSETRVNYNPVSPVPGSYFS